MATLGAGRIAANRSAYPMAHDRENRPPTERGRTPAAGATRAEIDAFLAQVKGLAPTTAAGQRGRLIFALDATMQRRIARCDARRVHRGLPMPENTGAAASPLRTWN